MKRNHTKVRIGSNTLEDTISRGENGGKIGLFTTRRYGIKGVLPDTAKQQDFPGRFSLKTKNSRFGKDGSVMTRTQFEQVKHKEEQVNLSGKESKRLDNFEYQGERPLVYNPFAEGAGNNSEVAGTNAGGDPDFSNRKVAGDGAIIKPQFELKKNKGQISTIKNPEVEPPVLLPYGQKKVRTTIKIR